MALTAPSSTLTGQTIAASYDQVLFLDAAAGVTEATLKIVSGTAGKTALSISDEHVLVKGVDTNNAAGFEVQQTDGTSILKVAADTPAATLIGPLTVGANDLGHDVKLFGATSGKFMLWDEDQDSLMFTDSTNLTFGTGNDADVYYDGTDLNINPKVVGSGRLHILGNSSAGIAGTDGTFHVHTATAGSVTANTISDDLVIENSAGGGLTILTPDANDGRISIGSASDNIGAALIWNYDSGLFTIGSDKAGGQTVFTSANGDEAMRIDASGNVGIGVTPTQPLHVAKSFNGDYAALIHNTHETGGQGLMIRAGDGADETVLSIRNQASTALATFLADGNVGIGDTSPDAHLDVEDATVDTDASYTGISNAHIKTAGDSNASDHYRGIINEFQFNDADTFFGELNGIYNVAYSSLSFGQSVEIAGLNNAVIMGGSTDVNNVYGIKSLTDVDAGTVDTSVYGQRTLVDIDGGTIGDHIWGHLLDMNTTVNPTGNVFGIDIHMAGAGVDATADYFLRCYDKQNSDTVCQITALAGVATFDSGDFSGAPDYAEYFESKSGSAIAIGSTVKLDGDKIVVCEEGDTPVGVVRPKWSSSVVCGSAPTRWAGKYLKDDYDEVQMEDYTMKKWEEEVDFDEYIKRGKTGEEQRQYSKVEGSKAIEAKDAVEAVEAQDAVYETVTKQRQKVVVSEVEEEVSSTEIVLEDGKYVQKTTTETVTKEVETPQYEEVTLYDEDGEEIGTHQVPIMEDYEEDVLVSKAVTGVVGIAAVEAVDAVSDTYFREHCYHSDRMPEGVTAPDDAETLTPVSQRKKLNPDYDESQDYVKRADRDGWCLIGLLGQIPIAKGQPVADNWIKMKDVSDTVEMYFVK